MTFTVQLSEAEFQGQLVKVAESLGWDWMHIGRTGKYVANGAKGTLGTGWPDLLLLRGHRIVCAELKAQDAPLPSISQREVLLKLSGAVEAYCWRPSQWNEILEVLA